MDHKNELDEIIASSSQIAEQIEDVLDENEMQHCLCSMALVMGKALRGLAVMCTEDLTNKHSMELIKTCVSMADDLQKILFHVPALAIGEDFEQFVKDKIKESLSKDEKVSVPQGKEMESLLEKLFTPGEDDE